MAGTPTWIGIGLALSGSLAFLLVERWDRMRESAGARARLESAVPIDDMGTDGFVGSSACGACHASEHATWSESYHRTMTQKAFPDVVLGDFDGVDLHLPEREWSDGTLHHERRFELERRRDGSGEEQLWVRMPDPDWEQRERAAGRHPDADPQPPLVRRRVVMTTGSHQQQTCWVEGEQPGRPHNLPFMWLVEDGRWVPRDDVFMAPPRERQVSTWNDNCIQCHSVAGWWHLDPATRSGERVAELGIACEACHGPGAEHVRANRSPARRYSSNLTQRDEESIVNPAELSPARSSQVCGQCHGIHEVFVPAYLAGERYRPGEELNEVHRVVRGSAGRLRSEQEREWYAWQAARADQKPPYWFEDRFWPDGMVRVSGREYNAMIESACFDGGELSCLSCHSMHDYEEPNHQMSAGMSGDRACLQCHAEEIAQVEEHTHHPIGSSGSTCTNCHMPHTVWGLLQGMRSHWIDSPSVASSLATGRPNACNLCHLDRSLGWSAGYLEEWYGQQPPALDEDERSIAGSLLWLLSGDANQRGLVAWHMGWEPAREASGSDWMPPFLANAMVDSYAAVRYVGGRSLASLPGYEDLDYDFVRPDASIEAVRAIARGWRHPPAADDTWPRIPELLVEEGGELHRPTLMRLIQARDERRVVLEE